MTARTTHPVRRPRRWVRTATMVAVLPLTAAPLLATAPAHAEGAVSVTADVAAPNQLGWYSQNTSVGLEVVAEDGVDHGSWKLTNDGRTIAEGQLDEGHTEVPIDTEGTNVLRYVVVGPTGRQSAGSRELKLDRTPPTIEVTAPTEGTVVRQGASLTARYSCSDALSQLTTCVLENGALPGDTLDTSTPGLHRVNIAAVDRADHQQRRTITYRVTANDTTAPTVDGVVVKGHRGSNGWFDDASVTFRTTAVDPVVDGAVTSGLHHLDTNLDGEQLPQSPTSPVDVTVTGEGEHTLLWAAADNADNASGVRSVDIDIDSVAPTATISYPANGAVLSADSASNARYACADVTSGIESCEVAVDDRVGAALDLSPGPHLVQVIGFDRAGHPVNEVARYTVPGAEASSRTRITDLQVHRRTVGSATITVRAGDDVWPEGTVRILDGRQQIAVAPVVYVPDSGNLGRAVLDLPRLPRGVHKIRAIYSGAQLVEPSRSKAVRVRVR